MDELPIYFEHSSGMYKFFDDGETTDSGVEDVPFTNYVELESGHSVRDSYSQSSNPSDFHQDEEELAFIDDMMDKDYKPQRSHHFKRGKLTYSRPQYSESASPMFTTLNPSMLITPEKQFMYGCDSDSNGSSSVRYYARKDRTPNTIKKMMEKHRESERVRHHSLNESLKDVCLRVPGYDPGAKETKVVQMQRIIGYECFLENTFRSLCNQLGVPAKLVLKNNTQFISDAINNTPISEFYQPGSFKMVDDDGDDDESIKMIPIKKRKKTRSPTPCKDLSWGGVQMHSDISGVLKSSHRDKNNNVSYTQAKISSPTVDSTTDLVRLVPELSPSFGLPRYMTKYEAHSHWQSQSGFQPIGSSQENLSQESGIRVETQSSLDDDCNFQDMQCLISSGLYDEPEQLRTVTPSFMKEETVSTSTCGEDKDEGFDLSSPVRSTNNVFLHSPPTRGIWHSASKHLPDKADTPGHKEMQTVAPENVLETKPKLPGHGTDETDSHVTQHRTQVQRLTETSPLETKPKIPIPRMMSMPIDNFGFYSTIRPMTEILSLPAQKSDVANRYATSKIEENSFMKSLEYLNQDNVRTPSYSTDNLRPGKFRTLHNLAPTVSSTSVTKPTKCGSEIKTESRVNERRVIKTVPIRNVKVNIIHASPVQRSNLKNKFAASSMVPAIVSSSYRHPSKTLADVIHESPQFVQEQYTHLNEMENTTCRKLAHGVTPGTFTLSLRSPDCPGTDHVKISPFTLGSPETKNKRKRYTPLRSPFLDRTNQEDGDDGTWTSEDKKYQQREIKNDMRGSTRSESMEDLLPAYPNAHPSVCYESTGNVKEDYRRSTWMNGFMMFSHLHRRKYMRENPGVHSSVIQKILGQKWRSMSQEEQLHYREKANEYSSCAEVTQTCSVDSSSS